MHIVSCNFMALLSLQGILYAVHKFINLYTCCAHFNCINKCRTSQIFDRWVIIITIVYIFNLVLLYLLSHGFLHHILNRSYVHLNTI